MPFGPERKQSIRVPIGKRFEDVLALSDIESLALQVSDDGFGQLVQSEPCIFPTLSRHDHLPQKHSREIVPRWPASSLGLVSDTLLTCRLLGIALLLRFPGHCVVSLLWSLSVIVGDARNKRGCLC